MALTEEVKEEEDLEEVTFGLIRIPILSFTVRLHLSMTDPAGWTMVVMVVGIGQEVFLLIIRLGIQAVESEVGEPFMASMLAPSSLWLRTGAINGAPSAKNATPPPRLVLQIMQDR